jgi:heptosyltransferase-1
VSGQSPRILITRLSAIGDCIVTTPMLLKLREYFPAAFIAWAVEPAAAQLLTGHAGLDEIIEIPRKWMKRIGNYSQLRRRLRSYKFDIAIDPQGLTKSAAISWLSGAPRRIGFRPPQSREISHWLNNELVDPQHTHITQRQLELLRLLDVDDCEVNFDLPLYDEAQAEVDQWLVDRQLTEDYVVINPGAGWRSRMWDMKRYASVARFLSQRFGLPSVVSWGNDEERSYAQAVVSAAGGDAILAPPTTLPELASLLRTAKMYLGSDTGPTHMAAATSVPCVCICGTTRGEYSGPYGESNIILQAYYQGGTTRDRRRADNEAMLAITVDTVSEACYQILTYKQVNAA